MQHKKIDFIYWFAYYNLDSSSVRYRAKYPLEFARKEYSINYYLVWPNYSINGILLFSKAYFSALLFRKKNSVIVIQRIQSNFIYANLLKFLVRLRKSNTVYDLDDADYLTVNPETIHFFAKYCSMISSGSDEIQNYLVKYNSNVIHTTSPVIDLQILKKNKNQEFIVGWIGDFSGDNKNGIIDLFFPALIKLDFYFRLKMMGVEKEEDRNFIRNYFSKKTNIKIELIEGIDWNNENEIQKHICSFDIGIAILLDTPIQLAKSGIKAKQYLNNGVPVLSSNIGENVKVISDGVNGYFCNNVEEFKEKITEFRNMNEGEYLSFSINARKSIKNFSHELFLNRIFTSIS